MADPETTESLFAAACVHPTPEDPEVEALVTTIIGQVADKWTLLILETLTEGGVMRFSEIARAVGGISQKMLTKTLRDMERIGLVSRTVFPSCRRASIMR